MQEIWGSDKRGGEGGGGLVGRCKDVVGGLFDRC